MNEAQFQKQVVDLAHYQGWHVFHTYDSRRSTGSGFPDLVLVRGGEFLPIFAELKTSKGQLSAVQKTWRKVLEQCPGADYRLWRPEDWPEIEATLNRRASVIRPNVHDQYPEDEL